MDNDYLNGYAKHFGAVGTAVYLSLCRHADNETQKCFPAQKLIAEEVGIERKTVIKYIRLFSKYHLIKIERERDRDKKWANNVYTLLDKENWSSPEAMSNKYTRVGHVQMKDKSHVQQIHTKDTQDTKETHISNASVAVNPILELFKGLNPSYERLYSNKTQRGAVDRLLKKYGADKVSKMIEYAESVKSEQYAPVITTPLQLENSLGKLIAFYEKQKSRKPMLLSL